MCPNVGDQGISKLNSRWPEMLRHIFIIGTSDYFPGTRIPCKQIGKLKMVTLLKSKLICGILHGNLKPVHYTPLTTKYTHLYIHTREHN